MKCEKEHQLMETHLSSFLPCARSICLLPLGLQSELSTAQNSQTSVSHSNCLCDMSCMS